MGETVWSDAESIVERARLLEDSPHFGPTRWIGKNTLPKTSNVTIAESRASKALAVNTRIGSVNRTRIRLWLIGWLRWLLIIADHCAMLADGIKTPPAERL